MIPMPEAKPPRPLSYRYRFVLASSGLLLIIAIFAIMHITVGKIHMTPGEVIQSLLNQEAEASQRHIVWHLRLPRVLIAIASGVMLGTAGAILQVIMRNPLVEPGLIGASAGGVLFAAIWMVYAPATAATPAALPFVALAGGISAAGVVYLLNGRGKSSSANLALIGIVVTAILQSLTSFLLLKNQQGLATIFLWNFGSLNGRVWVQWNIIWPWALAGLVLAMAYARKAGLLQMGDAVATGLGLAVNRTRLILLAIAAMLTAASVSVVGAIGFIGLIGPHIAALIVGRNPVYLFPASALFSASLLVAADWIGQSVTFRLPIPGMENHLTNLPVGAVTTLMGAPFFLFLLRRTLMKK